MQFPTNPVILTEGHYPEQQYLVKHKRKYLKLLLLWSLIFIVAMLICSTIAFGGYYKQDTNRLDQHMHILKVLGQSSTVTDACYLKLSSEKGNIDALSNYYGRQNKPNKVFTLMSFIFAWVSFAIFVLLLLLKRDKYPKGMIPLLFLVLIIFSIIVIVEFIYYMSVGEDYTNSLKRLQGNLDKYYSSQCNSYSYGASTLSYTNGYLSSILDIVRPIVIAKFVIVLIFLIGSVILFGLHMKKAK